MKNLMFTMMLVSILSISACAQSNGVPTKVKTSFEQKFPNAKKVSWDKENAKEWEAEFKMNGKEYSANFTNEGMWKETEHEISKSEIPSAVKSTLENQFKGYKIEESEISETSTGKVYEFELEKRKSSDLEVAISPEGKIVKKEVKDEEDDEDND